MWSFKSRSVVNQQERPVSAVLEIDILQSQLLIDLKLKLNQVRNSQMVPVEYLLGPVLFAGKLVTLPVIVSQVEAPGRIPSNTTIPSAIRVVEAAPVDFKLLFPIQLESLLAQKRL